MPRFILIVLNIISTYINIANCEQISNFKKPDTMPKYFAIDIDDTFYIEDEDMMKKNIEAFKLLKTKNIIPFFCTGRDPGSNQNLLGQQFFTETGYSGYPGVYANGSLVYDGDGNLIYTKTFTDSFLERFKEFVDTKNISNSVVYHTVGGVHSLAETNDKAKNFLKEKKIPDLGIINYNELKQKTIVSISFFDYSFDDCDFKNEVYYVKYPKYETMQLSPLGCNKKTGLEKLLEHFKSNQNECAFVGDSNNDIEALQYCTLSFAVNNASDEVKEKAKWVVDLDFDKGAFAKIVELMVH